MSEVRDLGFLAWKDPDAWMEKMRGSQWEALVNEENQRLQKVLHGKEELISKFKKELTDAAHLFEIECFKSGPIHITPLGAFSLKWRFEGSNEYVFARDIYSNGKIVAYTHDIGDGSEQYELVVLDATTRKTLWHKSPVGPNITIIGEKIYYLGVIQKLWYNKLFSCTALTGANITQIYEEKDGHYNLTLQRPKYLIRENAGKTDTFIIKIINGIDTLKQYYKGSERQLTGAPSGSPSGEGTGYYKMPGDTHYFHYDEYIQNTPFETNNNYVLIRDKGQITVYSHEMKSIYKIKQGTITLDNYGNGDTLRIDDGTQPPYCYTWANMIENPTPRKYKFYPYKTYFNKDAFKLITKHVKGVSADGTEVHGVLLFQNTYNKPKALFAVGYGAYGVASSPAGAYAKWTPLLKRGWGILYTYIRGGGDDTDAWAQAGRLEGRKHTRDDFLALVEAAQKQFKISATNTVIYGRSAGGFLMGMCLNKEPTGRLFSAVYTEVPYVDILRTTTNPALPLTKMEYNEFGDPAHRPEDFGFLVDMSPADIAITTEAPNIFVLARTGLNDSEVYAYEPVKWIRRLRKPGDKEEKVIGIARGEGHFYSGEAALQAKAEDLAILHSRIFPFGTFA